MQMPGRDTTFKSSYRYGFNGKEMDNEAKGVGNQVDYGNRIYDPRVGRFLSKDPLAAGYPWNSPYSFAENDVIRAIDLDGLEKVIYIIKITPKNISTTKLELQNAGPLGDGVAVQLKHNGEVHNFYGTSVASAIDFTKSYEGTGIPGHPFERYNDSRGNATIGNGHLMSDQDKTLYPITASNHPFVVGSKILQDDAETQFGSDYAGKVAMATLALQKNKITLSGGQLEAMTDFGFNIRNASQRIGSFTLEQGGDFFLGYLGGGIAFEKRRIGEAIMYNSGQHILFNPINNKKENRDLNDKIELLVNPAHSFDPQVNPQANHNQISA